MSTTYERKTKAAQNSNSNQYSLSSVEARIKAHVTAMQQQNFADEETTRQYMTGVVGRGVQHVNGNVDARAKELAERSDANAKAINENVNQKASAIMENSNANTKGIHDHLNQMGGGSVSKGLVWTTIILALIAFAVVLWYYIGDKRLWVEVVDRLHSTLTKTVPDIKAIAGWFFGLTGLSAFIIWIGSIISSKSKKNN